METHETKSEVKARAKLKKAKGKKQRAKPRRSKHPGRRLAAANSVAVEFAKKLADILSKEELDRTVEYVMLRETLQKILRIELKYAAVKHEPIQAFAVLAESKQIIKARLSELDGAEWPQENPEIRG